MSRNPSLNATVVASNTNDSCEDWRKNLRGEESEALLSLPRPDTWWTGKKPTGTVHSLPLPDLSNISRDQLLAYFDNTWTITETLYSGLAKEEAFYIPPYHNLRHPLVFYYVHTAVLYINKFLVAGLIDAPINPFFERIFETGVDEMSWDDMNKNSMDWPSIAECLDYRRKAYNLVRDVILTHPSLDKGSITIDDPSWAIPMGFEHERIHIETSSVLFAELPIQYLKKPPHWPDYHPSVSQKSTASVLENPLVPVAGAQVTLGKPRTWPSFGWDNEYGAQTYNVRSFEAARHPTTNGEFLEFVKALGYNQRKYWTEEGWSWRCFRNVKWPTFWVPYGPQGLHQYQHRVIFDVVDLVLEWPAIVNVHEAQAYCRWKSEVDNVLSQPYRLLTELEHNLIREKKDKPVDYTMVYSGSNIFQEAHINGQLAFSSPSPVNANPTNSKGFSDVFGNVWQWCSDFVAPLDGFEVHPLYQDFSDPCFDKKHSIIMGGSFISTGDELSIWSRFHFRGHFFQHAGFRLARNTDGNASIDTSCKQFYYAKFRSAGQMTYETDKLLQEYLDLHYGKPEDIFSLGIGPSDAAEFPKRCAVWTIERAKQLGIPHERVLDLGCAVGASTFYLAQYFNSAEGIDLSESFINAAKRLAETGTCDAKRLVRGEVYQAWTATIPEDIDRARVKFSVGDACDLPLSLGKYDAIMMANLICRVPNPRQCLDGIKQLVNEGGLVVMMTPFTWLPEYTPKDKWVGATNESPDSFEELTKYMTGLGFSLKGRSTLPLILRETERKFQFILSEASAWQLSSS